MKKEFEAKYFIDSKGDIRKKLEGIKLKLETPEVLMKRKVFCKKGEEQTGEYWRVRDEGNGKIVLTYKNIKSNTINGVDELNVSIDNYDNMCEILTLTGLVHKSYQESYRETWSNDEVEITIDEWPYLQPYIEIEAENEDLVKKYSEKLGFNYSNAYFGGVDVLYEAKLKYPAKQCVVLPVFTFNNKEFEEEITKFSLL
jgi:adenylate cyclase class 2